MNQSFAEPFTNGESATLACLLEVSVPKVGNVHRSADFDDATFYDFVVSAACLGKTFDLANQLSVGELVLDSVNATKHHVGTNTNLGMILLFAPLAKCVQEPTRSGVSIVLDSLVDSDCRQVTEAIRVANPGGLGEVPSNDVREEHDGELPGLIDLMKLAQDHDMIARQYANGFSEFFDSVFPMVMSAVNGEYSLPDSLVFAHLKIMAEFPDSLIARKCGNTIANECSAHAKHIVNEFEIGTSDYHDAIADFDFWLRSDGHRRNPGTSADLLAAALFVGLRSGAISRNLLQRTLALSRNMNN